MRPRLLDLFCGAGGAAMGYHRAGFEVVGVDIKPQPNYPFRFIEMDALEFACSGDVHEFDAIHASPPCQAYSEGGRRWPEAQAQKPRLIAPTRELLLATGLSYVIENVQGAKFELISPYRICGRSSHPLLARHRFFETNVPLLVPNCTCYGAKETVGIYGEKPDGRELNSRYPGRCRAARSLEEAQEIMGMAWGNWYETKEAIPPSYTELIGHQLMAYLKATVAA